VLTEEAHGAVLLRAQGRGLTVPSYPGAGGQKKVSAAWLVENSGFAKGYVEGRVGLSRKHALAIVNRGGARAQDILELRNRIQQRVEELWGVRLVAEPVVVDWPESGRL